MQQGLQAMGRHIDRCARLLAAQPFWVFVITVYVASLLTKIAIMLLVTESARAIGQPMPHIDVTARRSLTALFLQSVLLAPLLETWLNQTLPLWLGRRLTHRALWPVLVSGLLFGLLHYHQGLAGIIHASVLGWVFAAAYWYRRASAAGHPYLSIVFVHALHNLLTWTLTWVGRSGLAV